MSAKLIIKKFEEDNNPKTLNILIEDSDVVQFGEWQDGDIAQTKKDYKSARLVVKIVSGLNNSKFNLDTCSRELQDNCNVYSNNDFFNLNNFANDIADKYNDENIIVDDEESLVSKASNVRFNKRMINTEIWAKANSYDERFDILDSDVVNPLEHTLERVRENNAKIMANINLLNRTLYYTKKKENLNILSKSMRSFPCKNCGKCFVYETGLKRHYALRHAITEMQPRWQIVWTCIQCFQVWPQPDQAIEHSNECFQCENAECVREIKTSSLLQCEFCDKVFTSIPRLLRHSKSHNTSKNYECYVCGISFLSYKIAEEHWISCKWLKMYYSFSLPKLLLCNACDRKFRNYDQLYNHRYKLGHFITKTHSTDANSLGVLVYQCEICAQWFLSIPLLIAHKAQCHNTESNITLDFEQNIFSETDNQENSYISEKNYDETCLET